MGRQWHPLFAHLMRLLVQDYYEVQAEVPVSELPRQADLLLLRRLPGEPAPFQGLWSHLTDWNVLEFKGPTDAPEEKDLELLLHVGTGLTFKLNEERTGQGEASLPNRQVSFWYLAPRLGDTFLGHARGRSHFEYDGGGLWRGSVWGHPVWLLSYRDAPVEEDCIPLHLMDTDRRAPPALGAVVARRQEWLQRFGVFVSTLQPDAWEEIRRMATTKKDGPSIDWEAVSRYADLADIIPVLPAETVIQRLGLDRILSTVGVDKLLDELLKHVPPEQIQEMLRQRQKETTE